MSQVTWNFIPEIEAFRSRMDRAVGHFLPTSLAGLPRLDLVRPLQPLLEVYMTENELVVKAELPGADPQEVTVELTDGSLHLAGETHKATEIREDGYHRTERQYGRFDRTLSLPCRIREHEARAYFQHGVLTLRAPLAEQAAKPRGRRVTIEH